MHALRVNETNLISGNAFIVNPFALESEKESSWLEELCDLT